MFFVIFFQFFRGAEQMDIVFGFSCGHRGKDGPGLSNEAMAKIIAEMNPDIVSVQVQIGQALRDLGITPDHEVSAHRKPGRYLDTEETAHQMLDFVRTRGLYRDGGRVFVIAHPIHLPRCVAVLRKLGITAVVYALYARVPCDPKSYHFWTRSPLLIYAHEILGFPIYFLRGYYMTT